LQSSLTRSSPALYVLDPAVPAYKKDRPRRSLIVGGAFVGSLLLGFVGAMILDQWRRMRRAVLS
jgi:uncharacterized protein involved in exopolysaccharide biosynthesis